VYSAEWLLLHRIAPPGCPEFFLATELIFPILIDFMLALTFPMRKMFGLPPVR